MHTYKNCKAATSSLRNVKIQKALKFHANVNKQVYCFQYMQLK